MKEIILPEGVTWIRIYQDLIKHNFDTSEMYIYNPDIRFYAYPDFRPKWFDVLKGVIQEQLSLFESCLLSNETINELMHSSNFGSQRIQAAIMDARNKTYKAKKILGINK